MGGTKLLAGLVLAPIAIPIVHLASVGPVEILNSLFDLTTMDALKLLGAPGSALLVIFVLGRKFQKWRDDDAAAHQRLDDSLENLGHELQETKVTVRGGFDVLFKKSTPPITYDEVHEAEAAARRELRQ